MEQLTEKHQAQVKNIIESLSSTGSFPAVSNTLTYRSGILIGDILIACFDKEHFSQVGSTASSLVFLVEHESRELIYNVEYYYSPSPDSIDDHTKPRRKSWLCIQSVLSAELCETKLLIAYKDEDAHDQKAEIPLMPSQLEKLQHIPA